MSISFVCRSSLFAAVSAAALSCVIGHSAHAQSRPDLDAQVISDANRAKSGVKSGAKTSAKTSAKPVAKSAPGEPIVLVPQDEQAIAESQAGLSSSGGALAALEEMFKRSAAASNDMMNAQAAMTMRDASEPDIRPDVPPVQAAPMQIAQSQPPIVQPSDADSLSPDLVDPAPAVNDRRARANRSRSVTGSTRADLYRGAYPAMRGVQPAPVRYVPNETVVPYDPSYRVDAGDRLRIVVFGQDGLTNTYQIGASGSITMPLIGSVPARGRTPAQLAGAITARLRDGYIRAPSVAVEIEAYRPFFILGEVAAPGQYPYVPNMSVESAIAIAGGFSPRARRDSVTLTQAMPDGLMRSSVPVDTPLRPGDTIMVGERWF